MKKRLPHARPLTLFAVAVLLVCGAPARAANAGRADVMILGVAHLVARRDVHNSVFADSPLAPQRQAQILAIVRRLGRFHPTKVLVEASLGDAAVAERYRRYRAGRFALGANEVYQFGFRLAALAGNTAVYPVDADGPVLIDDTSARGKQMNAFLASHFRSLRVDPFDAFLARQEALERRGTYLDLLRYLNSDDAIRANASFYSVLDGTGREADDAGSTYVSQWYARNCAIFSNILSVIRAHDRVVVMFGQGHEYLLREFVRLNPNLRSVDPLTYLR